MVLDSQTVVVLISISVDSGYHLCKMHLELTGHAGEEYLESIVPQV